MLDTVYTVNECAEILKVSRDTVIRYAHLGQIPHFRIGRRVLFREISLKKYIEEQEAMNGQ